MHNLKQKIEEELRGIDFSVEKEDLTTYGKDWTNFYTVDASVVLFPKTTLEIQQIILFANKYKIGIVPSGGRTGLSGGAVAINGEIVLSLKKMNKILTFNSFDQTIKVEAGVVTQEIQEFAEKQGLYYPVSFGSKGSSHIGGNIATNAGGIRVVKYGLTREQIIGLTFVTGKGEILHLNKGLLKNATGYDFRHLVIGSEGTLGIVTEAEIRLSKQPQQLNVVFLAVEKIDDILNVLEKFRKDIDVSAFEFLSHLSISYCSKAIEQPLPFKKVYPYYILIEFDNPRNVVQQKLEALIMDLYEHKTIREDLIVQDRQSILKMWKYREEIPASIASFYPYKNDISFKASLIPAFIKEAEQVINKNYPNFEVLWYGHIADGNIHINILKPKTVSIAAFKEKCDKVNKLLFDIVEKYGGSISAEHGVGLVKKGLLHCSRSPIEIEYMKAIKKLFDPNNIMNPGKLI